MKKEKIITTVKQLLALSQSTHSPHEAATAASKAYALMSEFQITQLMLNAAAEKVEPKLQRNDISQSQIEISYESWEEHLVQVVCDACHVYVYGVPKFGKGQIAILHGLEEDLILAQDTFKFLKRQVHLLTEEFMKDKLSLSNMIQIMESFQGGVVIAIGDHLEKANALAEENIRFDLMRVATENKVDIVAVDRAFGAHQNKTEAIANLLGFNYQPTQQKTEKLVANAYSEGYKKGEALCSERKIC